MRRMKFWMLVCSSAVVLAAQSENGNPAGVPSTAVKATDGYHYTDTDGRQWIYRPTPFGIARVRAEEAASAKAAKTTADDGVRATDHGATVSFERPGPFGVYRWERKKPDLDASERAALQRAPPPLHRQRSEIIFMRLFCSLRRVLPGLLTAAMLWSQAAPVRVPTVVPPAEQAPQPPQPQQAQPQPPPQPPPAIAPTTQPQGAPPRLATTEGFMINGESLTQMIDILAQRLKINIITRSACERVGDCPHLRRSEIGGPDAAARNHPPREQRDYGAGGRYVPHRAGQPRLQPAVIEPPDNVDPEDPSGRRAHDPQPGVSQVRHRRGNG